jgi:hypothetical protein
MTFLHLDAHLFPELQEAERNVILHNFIDLFLKAPGRVSSHQGHLHDSTTDETRFVEVVCIISSVRYRIRIEIGAFCMSNAPPEFENDLTMQKKISMIKDIIRWRHIDLQTDYKDLYCREWNW